MLSLLIPEEIFHGEKNHRLFYSSKIRNSVRCRSKRDMYSKLVGGKNCWNDILRDKILWKDEISVRWKRRWNIGGGRSNGEWIRYRRGSTTSQNCVDSRVEAEPRRSEIYICMKCWRSNELGNGLHRQVMVDWISRKLVSLDEISLNLAARTGFR